MGKSIDIYGKVNRYGALVWIQFEFPRDLCGWQGNRYKLNESSWNFDLQELGQEAASYKIYLSLLKLSIRQTSMFRLRRQKTS